MLGQLPHGLKSLRGHIRNKNLLIIGLGNIGSRVASMMNPFMKISRFDIAKNSSVNLKKMISVADCISIHIPKTKQNCSFFDKRKLSWMKNHAVIINTARGAIVDENALYKELKSNRLSPFDVFLGRTI